MTLRGGTLRALADRYANHPREGPPARLPLVVHVPAPATFLRGTTEFAGAGLLPEIAADVQVGVARPRLLITVFAVGMVVGAPLRAMPTLRLTLILALTVFTLGHLPITLGPGFALRPAGRFLPAWATGAFWAVANGVAARTAGPAAGSHALGIVGAGAGSMLAQRDRGGRSAPSPDSSWAGVDPSGRSLPSP
ncbi:hypothetical protein [Streptomyces sp. NPDC019224]|uniref:hypothetical protein n=1 Tax=Streptomyces sp. NPDC019224 TaxID=3154484 RepID=UPI0033D858B9